jgi:hypothetical protein
MASKTQIANWALAKLGEERVSNIETTNTKPARVMNGLWDLIRDAMLESNRWKFSVTQAALPADGSDPAWDWNNQYALPSDFLSLVEIEDRPAYEVARSAAGSLVIMTDAEAPLNIKYVAKVTETGSWNPHFAAAMASKLAYEGCEEITGSNTKKEVCWRDFTVSMQQAFLEDAIENPPEELPEDSWIEARV